MINPYLHDCVALLYIFIALSLIYHYKQQPVKMGCIWLTAQIHFIDMWNNMNRSRQADFNTIILVCFFLSSTRSVFSKKKPYTDGLHFLCYLITHRPACTSYIGLESLIETWKVDIIFSLPTGTQPITANNSYKEKEDTATEERIANILSEAQVAMHMKKSLEQVFMRK